MASLGWCREPKQKVIPLGNVVGQVANVTHQKLACLKGQGACVLTNQQHARNGQLEARVRAVSRFLPTQTPHRQRTPARGRCFDVTGGR
jgi:hypothetical protein